ncbi:envelope stress induced periplasmic protein [Pseudoalteromonas luteoviolacea B = ATCC 29581]|nr:envelope stress induced periplasmic protein [Pseudoalteromonas luteoviolacea B = ATCC 29581]
MNTKKILLAGFVGLGLALSSGVTAKGHDGGHEAFILKHRIAQKLGLTESQKSEIQQILEQGRELIATLGGDRQAHLEQLKALLNDATFDETKARAILQGQQPEQLEIQIEQLRTRHQVLQVLTDEQRVLLESLKEDKRDKGPRRQK